MQVYPVTTQRFWLIDPFHKRDAQFFACSEACRAEADRYYADYHASVKKFGWGMTMLFCTAYGISIPFGYAVIRWTLPAAIGLGGFWLFRHPYANSFRRDAEGSLKISLKRSRRDARWLGIVFASLSVVFMLLNFWVPSQFPFE